MQNESFLTVQFIASFITIIGAGISVYVALRISNAENKKDIEYLRKGIDEQNGDIKDLRLEIRELHKRLNGLTSKV